MATQMGRDEFCFLNVRNLDGGIESSQEGGARGNERRYF